MATSKGGKLTRAEIEQRREARTIHGGAAAVSAISAGEPFSGLAREQEIRVEEELETAGVAEIVKRDAIRLQVTADLYYAAILGADTLEQFDTYVKRFGWLQGHALRAWTQYDEIRKRENRQDITDLLSGGGDARNPD